MHGIETHRHGRWTHAHHHHGPHRHLRYPVRSSQADPHSHGHDHHHDQDHTHDDARWDGHGHSHGLVDASIVRSRAGVRAVALSLAVLAATAAAQAVVFMLSGSVALLADLIHNGGDALTAIPLGVAFWLGSTRGERWAGYAVVFAIFASATVAGVEAIDRLVHPQTLNHLAVLAIAGVVGFAGNELAANVRLRAGRRLRSAALIADGHHARVDGFVSLGVVLAAGMVAIGLPRADPIVGLAITALILRITWQAWQTVRQDRSS
ncbi:MAG TPA: cation diffusion facilitator family transporter [Acidimicrobiia bacterium]|nr:cation diffusion facilitator family transporter [Acidimicrobiia bacterium]